MGKKGAKNKKKNNNNNNKQRLPVNDNKFSLSEVKPTAEPGLAVAAEAGDHGQPTVCTASQV
jgi:hypothetical protein